MISQKAVEILVRWLSDGREISDFVRCDGREMYTWLERHGIATIAYGEQFMKTQEAFRVQVQRHYSRGII